MVLLSPTCSRRATTIGIGVKTEGATTKTSGLDAGMDSGNIHESLLRSHEAPLPEEKELQQTKSTYRKAVLTLVERVKLLEAALKRKSMKNVSTYKRTTRLASKGKDIGIGMDFFSTAKERLNSAKVEVNTEVNPGSAGVNTGNTLVSTPSVIQTVNVIVLSPLDAFLAKRIQEEQELSEQQQKRKAKVQEAAQFYTEEDWDTIRAKLEANAELTKSLQGENVSSEYLQRGWWT
ncbi:hypothetical protein Tco_0320973 [Tanacetum coccineum]